MLTTNEDELSVVTPSGKPTEEGMAGVTRKYMYHGERNAQGQRHGYGISILTNGDVYSGEFKNGVRDGYGEYIYAKENGAKYSGYYKDNKKSGHGVFVYPNGSK